MQQDLVATFGRSTLIVEDLAAADKEQMMNQLAAAFQFPSWFGRNWDALNDSMAERATGSRWPDLVVFRPARPEEASGVQNLMTLADIVTQVAEESKRWFLFVGAEPSSVPTLPTG